MLLKDASGITHKSAERFYWYKIAETFGDVEAMKKILEAPTYKDAEEAVKNIHSFDDKAWTKESSDIFSFLW